jgi:hypothetical protein
MEESAFKSTFDEIRKLDGSEGPSRNIFEPRFQAREQALKLRDAVHNSFVASPSEVALLQLVKLQLLLGMNYFETEETAEGEKTLLQAYAGAVSRISGTLQDPLCQTALTLSDVLRDEHDVRNCDATTVELWMETLNTIGVFLSNRSSEPSAVQDARRVLHAAESVYHAFETNAEVKAGLESLMTSTVYFLAQAYGAAGNGEQSARYVHDTMVRQLQTGVEFDKQSWATNAVHLAAFYAGDGHYGCALHCLNSATAVMPDEPRSEETQGVVLWGTGKFWKTVLRDAAEVKEGHRPQVVATTQPAAAFSWWKDLPVAGIDGPCSFEVPRDYPAARDAFRHAIDALQAASQLYTFDSCCPDFIAIQQDIADCLKRLEVFEEDVERKAAMLRRRIALLEPFPDQLAFQAYATLVRQLWYDLGEYGVDLFDLRMNQRERKQGRPLSVRQLNFLNGKTVGFFENFVRTLKKPDGTIPVQVETELRVPVFRVKMRIARMIGKRLYKSPEAEYEGIQHTIDRYADVLAFVDANSLASNQDVATEVALARQMKELLPGKQRDLRRAFR